MTISAVPFALQNVPINADVVRQAMSSLVPNGGGLVQTGDLAVTQLSTPAMGVQVGVGRCWIDGTNLAHLSSQGYGKQGMYFLLNDAPYTVTISTADATNPRIDVIYAAVQDASYAGASNGGVLAVATGTPTASAAYPANAPSLPANSIALAWVMVGAGVTTIVTSNITSLATSATVPMGHAGRTAGFQVINTADTSIVLSAAQMLRGGMTFDPSAGGRLVVPIAGLYRVNAQFYYSGSAGVACTGGVYKNGSNSLTGCRVVCWKGDASDTIAGNSSILQLAAGDKIGLGGSSSANAWGTDGYNGCYLEAQYLGPA